MKTWLAGLLCAGLAVATALPAHARTGADANGRFTQLYTAEWTWRQQQLRGVWSEDSEEDPSTARLPDVSPEAQAARLKRWEATLAELDAIPLEGLSPENRVNYAVYRAQVEGLAASVRFRDYEMPFNSDSQFWSSLGFMTRRPLKDTRAAEAYLARLADVPRYFDAQIANMRAGLKRGFSVPRAVLDGRDVSIATYAEVENPEDSEFYNPLKSLPATISETDQARLREQARATIAGKVIPAYGKLLTFFREEYVPGARTTLAAEAMPGGKEWYRQQVREYTTLDLSPEEIHQIGLKEVARIKADMQATIKETGFEGDFPAFLEFLRTDPQFYAKTPEELLMNAAWIAKKVDAKLGQFFGLLPRGRFTIVPVPPAIAPFWTAGRGGAGTYWVNTYDLPSRPLYNLPALTLHEAAPGHAMQGSLAAEQDAYPDFRSKSYISAYGEGWGLYVEKLGQEMGIYETPYQEFGRQTYEMWRAARLVIDTGVHHKGWTREQAIDYLASHTALSHHEVTTEVDRYISWPAQALSYKLGEMKIVELRKRGEDKLGTAFDLPAFHDFVLALGSVPLPVLEEQVDAWIERGGKSG